MPMNLSITMLYNPLFFCTYLTYVLISDERREQSICKTKDWKQDASLIRKMVSSQLTQVLKQKADKTQPEKCYRHYSCPTTLISVISNDISLQADQKKMSKSPNELLLKVGICETNYLILN